MTLKKGNCWGFVGAFSSMFYFPSSFLLVVLVLCALFLSLRCNVEVPGLFVFGAVVFVVAF